MLGLPRKRRVQSGDLVVGGTTVHRDQLDGPGLLGRLHHLRDGEQRHVDDAARDVARQGFQQPRQQRRGQMRPIGLQRVEHLRGVAPCVVGGQAPGVEYTGGQERRRKDLDVAGQRQRLADGAAAALRRRQSTAGRRQRQHRGNNVQAFQPQHLLDQVGRLQEIGPPTRRRDGQAVAGIADRGADLGQPPGRRTRAVAHTGHAVRQVSGQPDRWQ